jgi:hypothetical protein
MQIFFYLFPHRWIELTKLNRKIYLSICFKRLLPEKKLKKLVDPYFLKKKRHFGEMVSIFFLIFLQFQNNFILRVWVVWVGVGVGVCGCGCGVGVGGCGCGCECGCGWVWVC